MVMCIHVEGDTYHPVTQPKNGTLPKTFRN